MENDSKTLLSNTIQEYDTFKLEEGIKRLLRERNMTFKSLCQNIDMTENGLKASLKKRTLKLMTLLEISAVLNVSLFQILAGNDEHSLPQLLDLSDKNKLLEEEVKKLTVENTKLNRFIQTTFEKDDLSKKYHENEQARIDKMNHVIGEIDSIREELKKLRKQEDEDDEKEE